MLGGIAAGTEAFPNPPETIPRGAALGLLYMVPAAIGALGAIRLRRSVVTAAAVLAASGSILAFSGVTLVFLVPALLFAASVRAPGRTSGLRPRATTLALAGLAIPLAAVAALKIGIFALPLIVLAVLALGLISGSRRGRPAPSAALGGAAVATVIVVLGLAAGWTLFSMTETRCWQARQTEGGIVYEARTGDALGGGDGLIAAGCDSGALTTAGAGLASILAVAAIGVAALAPAVDSRRERSV